MIVLQQGLQGDLGGRADAELDAGAKPKSCRIVMSSVDALPYWNMALTRAALVLSSPKGRFTSAVLRTRPLVVTER